ncbi:MAG TPA: transferrin-binding protein-like solute binding protein [Burkholderiales bacterium]|nr:transferrin-binding protein-like solute binding protein [Burkholderiales bacterium]
MSRKKLESALLVSIVTAIAGCGGGGGGGTPPPAPEPFPSFTLKQPYQNQTFTVSGISQTGSGTIDSSGTVTSATFGPVDTANSTASISYDPTQIPSAFSFMTPQSNVTFDRNGGNTLICSSGVCEGDTATASSLLVDPVAVGWNYQTFGIWADAPSSTTWIAGAISVGYPTPASAVPTTGNATFTGIAAGFYVDPTGALFGTAANMTANADFTNRSIGFATSNTQVANVNGTTIGPNAGLDLSGTLTYSAGTNQFSGSVQTADTSLNGSATGQFYGPSAQEIGGTYRLTGSGVSGMLGAFGGKR